MGLDCAGAESRKDVQKTKLREIINTELNIPAKTLRDDALRMATRSMKEQMGTGNKVKIPELL